ncbi:hypothetical protein Thiosp_02984 [Thiorhodovibrio litoralis]|nr:hypothetical protein Thiosp_02984 [Thiorhodovibrio litoralis]
MLNTLRATVTPAGTIVFKINRPWSHKPLTATVISEFQRSALWA